MSTHRVRVTHSEPVSRVQKELHGRIGVYLRREAMLAPDLSKIEEKSVLAVRVVDMDGYAGESEWLLTPKDANALYLALGVAVVIANAETGGDPA